MVTYVRDLDGNDARRIWRALKPGGILVYENGASPKNEVLRAFLDFQILHFEDADETPDGTRSEERASSGWPPRNPNRARLKALNTIYYQHSGRRRPAGEPAATTPFSRTRRGKSDRGRCRAGLNARHFFHKNKTKHWSRIRRTWGRPCC